MSNPAAQDFSLRIDDVFTIAGRGTAVIGPIESGVLRTGDMVDIWNGEELVATVRVAAIEGIRKLDADPGSIGLIFADIGKDLFKSGQTIRHCTPAE